MVKEAAMSTESSWLLHLDGGRINYYDAGGIRTRVLEAGESGPAVLLIHGLGGHAEMYLHNLVHLGARGYRAFALDLMGHGLSAKPDLGYTMDDYVHHVVALADALGIENFHLVGNSLGALIAMRAAMAAPNRIDKVINAVGAGLQPIPPSEADRRDWSAVPAAKGEPTLDRNTVREHLRRLIHDHGSISEEMVTIRLRIHSDPDYKRVAQTISRAFLDITQLRAPGVLGPTELATFPVPVLFLWSDHNPTTPLHVAEAAHAMTPRSELALIRDCGHWPPFEKPMEFNELAANFFRS
jgi:pimeloyl-ACP methyl ester carboxylesterase